MNIMRTYGTKTKRQRSQGFTLIASLLMMLLLSGIAIGLMMMVNTEGKVGGTDLQNNLAYHAAEGGIEKMYSDLSAVFKNIQSPQASDICGISGPPLGSASNEPSMVGVSWTQYLAMPGSTQQSTCPTSMTMQWGQISAGPDQGLWAQVIPVNMLVTAASTGGQEVSMSRTAQVALIPVFQFGVFCEGDCGFFDSPNLTFAGRVHTNSDLYLGVSGGSTLVFNNKLEAYGNVVTEVLPNGLPATGGSWDDTGNVYLPTQNNGCSNPGVVTTDCILKSANNNPASSPYGDGSLQGAGGNPPQSSYNTSHWNTFSKSAPPNGTNKMLINGNYGSSSTPGTGAKKLSMPFVSGTTFPYEIIRRALPTDSTALSQSREENLAQIVVLLSDDPAELPTGSVRLANITSTEATATGGTTSNPYGIALTTAAVPAGGGTNPYITTALNPGGLPSGSSYTMYFAAASNGYLPDVTSCTVGGACTTPYLQADWLFAPATPAAGAQTLVPAGAPTMAAGAGPNPSFQLCAGAVGSLPAGCGTGAAAPPQPLFVNPPANLANAAVWNLIDGYLYVGYQDTSGNWHNATNEWLELGFARGQAVPTTPLTGNPINPQAILLLQEPADRNGSGGVPTTTGYTHCSASSHGSCVGTWSVQPPEVLVDAASGNPYFGVTTSAPAPAATSSTFTPTGQSDSMYNWYPINFYDAREGEPRDAVLANDSCTTNGLMNAVELDVGNLNQWLLGNTGTNGTHVNVAAQNGYVLYFSDRRGMMVNPNKGYKSGDSGLEDVVNSSSAAGVPDGVLEPVPAGHTLSPEDVNQNGLLDEWGTANLGLGQWSGTFNQTGANAGQITGAVNQNVQIIAAAPDNPYNPRMASCVTTGRKNWVSGARHVLKLVDGALGNVPMSPTTTTGTVNGNTVTFHGGFTVASENPVYIQGDYNSSPADTFFTGASSTGVPGPDMTSPYHSAASVIADAVTILSKGWSDLGSMATDPTQPTPSRSAQTSYYRVAVAAGKNIAFPFPSWENATDYGFGTDGGIHNFLRFLEDWSPAAGNQTLNYGGSLVSLYYATYNTGTFKCCKYSVYQPPIRNYLFDVDFTNPSGLPPATPMFRDVESLSYRQLFLPRASGQ